MIRPCLLAALALACAGKDEPTVQVPADPEPTTPTTPTTTSETTPDVDSDGDGLTNEAEIEAGSDPSNPDSDGDGLEDGEEVELGSDPNAVDTDGDTYTDFDEVTESHDPTDPEDRIYFGYWPYNRNKAALGDPGFDGSQLSEGDTFGVFREGVDQFGEAVDLYDFANQGRYVVIDASAVWCQPCQVMSEWLTGGADGFGFEPEFGDVRAAIDDGDLYWITVMTDGTTFETPSTPDEVSDWHLQYPHDRIPVLTDPDGDVLRAVNTIGPGYAAWPTYAVLDEQMTVVFVGLSVEALEVVQDQL